jgi:transcriptional regulator
MQPHLRPIERRVLAMRDEGLSVSEIASRINRSSDHVERVIRWTEIPRSRPAPARYPQAIETRVLALRSQGESHEQIGRRLGRGPRFVRQVEGLAHFRMAMSLLGSE